MALTEGNTRSKIQQYSGVPEFRNLVQQLLHDPETLGSQTDEKGVVLSATMVDLSGCKEHDEQYSSEQAREKPIIFRGAAISRVSGV